MQSHIAKGMDIDVNNCIYVLQQTTACQLTTLLLPKILTSTMRLIIPMEFQVEVFFLLAPDNQSFYPVSVQDLLCCWAVY